MAKNRIDKAIETVPGFQRMFAKFTQYMQDKDVAAEKKDVVARVK